MVKKPNQRNVDEEEQHFEQNANESGLDGDNRANQRQSKSANAARSLTRRN